MRKRENIYLLGLSEIDNSILKDIEKETSCHIERIEILPETIEKEFLTFLIIDLTEKGEKLLFDVKRRNIPFVGICEDNRETINKLLQAGAIDFLVKDKDKNYIKIFREYLIHLISHLNLIRKLKEEEEVFSTLSQQALFGIYVYGRDLKFRYVNKGFLNILGYSEEEFYKKEDALSIVHPEDREKVKERIKNRFEGREKVAEFPFRMIDRNGNVKWVYARGFLTEFKEEDVIMGTVADITEIKRYQEEIEKEKKELEEMLQDGIYALSKIVEIKDTYTFQHQLKVAEIAEKIGMVLKYDEQKIREILWAGLLHDIGKIAAVPGEILSKPSRLNEIEYGLIKQHPVIGFRIMKEIRKAKKIAEIILQHHERLDGSGYPKGLKKNDIIFEARLLAVADVIEAMSSHRPYRTARKKEEILNELIKGKGKKYDPMLVDIVIDLIKRGEINIEEE